MAGEKVDLKLIDNGEYYDLAIGTDGDLESVEGLETSLTVSFFTDARADSSEVSNPYYRRGWWGNLYTQSDQVEFGSKMWLLDQAVINDDTLNDAIDYAQSAYNWLLDQNYADQVNVSGSSSFQTINITVQIVKESNIINERVYNLWQNTIAEIA
jgi:phage gp46-like protein